MRARKPVQATNSQEHNVNTEDGNDYEDSQFSINPRGSARRQSNSNKGIAVSEEAGMGYSTQDRKRLRNSGENDGQNPRENENAGNDMPSLKNKQTSLSWQRPSTRSFRVTDNDSREQDYQDPML